MLLIIGGHQRSGTSLLQQVCNSHLNIRVTFEFGNFLALRRPYKVYRTQILRRWWNIGNKWPLDSPYARIPPGIRFWNFIFVMRYIFLVNGERRRRNRSRVDAGIIEAALRRMCPEAHIVGDKWPFYVFRLDKLAEVESLLRVIIYRDCRDVVHSTLKQARTEWKGPWVEKMNTAEKAARRWVEAIEIMERHADKLYIIRYEDLVRQPEAELAALGEWLGVDPAGFSAHTIRDTSIGKYKNGLTDEELTTIMEIAGPTMARLGYT